MQQRRIKIQYLFLAGIILAGMMIMFLRLILLLVQSRAEGDYRISRAELIIEDPLASLTTGMGNLGTTGEHTNPIETPGGADPPILEPDFEKEPKILIWAINPGYKVDNRPETGELIELRNSTGETVDLTGFSLRYTNSSGTEIELLEFPDGSEMRGESVLLRYSKSPNSEQGDLIYTTSLAMTAGPLELWKDDEKLDSVCWTGKTGCEKAFKSANPTTLVRNDDGEGFTHLSDYLPRFDANNPGLFVPTTPDDDLGMEKPVPRCREIEFSEVYAYYVNDKTEQFIELYNPSDQPVDIGKCTLRYKKKTYELEGIISPDGYYAYYPNGKFSLTKNPNTSNSIELVDADEKVVDELVYLHGQKKSTSYAKFYDASGAETWSHTYMRTPNRTNIYQEFRSCESGKVINPETGNCVKADTVASANGTCPAGKYRNPLTGRCKNIETEKKKKECAAGYERNPETGRCRKIKTANTGADYTLVPMTHSDNKVFVAAGIVVGLVSLGILYIVWQFRREIVRVFRKLNKRVHNIREDFLARRSSLDRDKKP